jgi:hypothetical protein
MTNASKANRPWGAAMIRPSDELLRVLTVEHTDAEIAQKYGVVRSAVSYWRAHADPPILRPQAMRPRLTHKQYIPWTVSAEHTQHHIARMLRTYSTQQQGKPLRHSEARQLERLIAYMDEHNLVIDYDPEVGWGWRSRKRGEKGLIRQPK